MIFDTHAHYEDDRFDEDRDELLMSMKENGIGRIVEVGAGISSTKGAIEIAGKYDFVYASVGVHPSETAELCDKDIEWLKSLTSNEKVVAVGEIGLDYYYDEPERDIQKKWFEAQLELAREVKLPVIIHSRDAAEDTLRIMKAHHAEDIGGVIHCFSYSMEIAKIYTDMGFYLGIGGALTFNNSKKLVKVVENIPLERLVLETDAPYLTPVPNRGKRNSSLNLKYVVEKIAGLKGISEEEVIRVTEENAEKLYRMG